MSICHLGILPYYHIILIVAFHATELSTPTQQKKFIVYVIFMRNSIIRAPNLRVMLTKYAKS